MRTTQEGGQKPRSCREVAAVRSPDRVKERGAILLMLIVTMIVVSILGAGVWYLNTSATDSQMLANNQAKAAWLAQSGIEYAMPIVIAANAAGQSAPITGLNNQTFTLSDGNRFYLRTDNTNASYTVVESTGIVNPNSKLQAQQKKTVQVLKSRFVGGNAGVQGHSDVVLETNAYVDSYDSRYFPWSVEGGRRNGTVATNSTASDKLRLRNYSDVYGNLVVGPGGIPSYVIQKDWSAEYTGTATAATVAASMTAVTDPGGGTGVIIDSDIGSWPKTLTAGIYRHTGTAEIKGTKVLNISGAVTLIVTSDFNMSNSAQINIQSGGSLTLIVMHNVTLQDYSVINGSGKPENCTIKVVNDIKLDEWAKVVGIFYAPASSSDFVMEKYSDLFGAVTAQKVLMKDSAAIHYDEALATADATRDPFVSY